MPRVVGTDPGTSSLDLLLLDDGRVADQHRFDPGALRDDPVALRRILDAWMPLDLIAGPSGYGLPRVRGEDMTESEIDLMALTRPDERGIDAGVIGFRGWVRAFLQTGIPTIFLPGGIHLPTIPAHRKANAIDMGTADKVAVAALAIRQDEGASRSFAVVEVGSAFTAILVVVERAIVDASAGSRGPIGLKSGGAWDGEAAYHLGPLAKADLFRGGWADLGEIAGSAFAESLRKHVAGLRSVTPFDRVYLSGAGLDRPEVLEATRAALDGLGELVVLPGLPGAWVKHAAQGSALIADGLAGGVNADLIEWLALRRASGTILDYLRLRTQPGIQA
jgi:predicted butyrate kinase (DUF1464 family)